MLRIALLILLLGSSALAQVSAIYTDARSWRLENYMGNDVTVWGSEAPCAGGRLIFDISATNEDKNRFWATVMAAKTSGKTMFVYYNHDNTAAACIVISFGLREE